jgi:maltose alpha-D-glucosyltransferase/alpha-amylase
VSAAYLDRFVEEQRLLAASIHPGEREEEIPYLRYMSQAGRRVAELHVALAGNSELAEFAPEPIGRDDVQRWIDDLMLCAGRVFDDAPAAAGNAEGSRPPLADQVLALQPRLPDCSKRCCCARLDAANIRCHGDLDLNQLLIVKDDIFIFDFEGATAEAVSPSAGARRPRRATSPAWSDRSIIRQPQPLSARSK